MSKKNSGMSKEACDAWIRDIKLDALLKAERNLNFASFYIQSAKAEAAPYEKRLSAFKKRVKPVVAKG